MTERFGVAGLLLLGLIWLAACGDEQPPERAVPPMPADLRVAVGRGGGVTGSWSQTNVLADGLVVRQDTLPDNTRRFAVRGHLPEERRRALWQDLHRHDVFAMAQEPGNMTEMLTVATGGATTRVAYPAGAGPAAFRDLLAAVARHLVAVEPWPTPPSAEGDGLALALTFVPAAKLGPRPEAYPEEPGAWSPALDCTLTNLGQQALRVPNGRTTAGYTFDPFGLALQVRNLEGEVFVPDPGAGGPQLPLTDAHFTRLEPGEKLQVRIPLGPLIHGVVPATRRLWREPNVYVATARWWCREGNFLPPTSVDGGAAPVWYGTTPQVRLPFVVE